MGKIYRVIVVEQDSRDADSFVTTAVPMQRVLFEAAGPDARRLLAYAPTEVEAALGGEIGNAIPDRPAPLVDLEALAASVLSAGKGESIASPDPEPQAVDAPAEQTPEAPKRKRRTKAEIAADEAAAARDRAERGAPQVGSEPTATHPATEPAPHPAGEPPAPVAAPVPIVPAPVPVVAVPPDGKPWNPFLQG
jgi:hypothetical protein